MRRLFLGLVAGVLSLGGLGLAAVPARADHPPYAHDHGRWERREHERWEHRRHEWLEHHRFYRPAYPGCAVVPVPGCYPPVRVIR